MDFEQDLNKFFNYLLEQAECYDLGHNDNLIVFALKYFKMENKTNEFEKAASFIMRTSIHMVTKKKIGIQEFCAGNHNDKIKEVINYCFRVVKSYWMF